MNTNATINSPGKLLNGIGSGTRWTIPREERRKILEQMERAREDQKRRKKKDWCRLDCENEFEEAWRNLRSEDGITDDDLELMRIDEGIGPVMEPEIKKARTNTIQHSGSQSNLRFHPKSRPQSQIRPHSESHPQLAADVQIPRYYHIVDFDCIENLLISLKRSKSVSIQISNAAKIILDIADDIYKSDFMFYSDLKNFDQPCFSYYKDDDDLSSLKQYSFKDDDLGRFSRSKHLNDRNLKFYRERAYRHRYISWKPYNLFFSGEADLKRIWSEIEYLDKNCDEFHFWMSRAICKRGSIFVSGNPLLKSFSLLLVLSRMVEWNSSEISNSIWSHLKYGTGWTLTEITKRPGIPVYLTSNRNSKLSHEASRMQIKFV